MAGRQQNHMGIPVSGIPADLTPSLDLNAVVGKAAPSAAAETVTAQPAQPKEPPIVPALACQAQACGEALVYIGQDGAAYLRVMERQVLRPHKLTETDLPLTWRCPRCGTPTVIAAPATAV